MFSIKDSDVALVDIKNTNVTYMAVKDLLFYPSGNLPRLPHEYQEVEYIESTGTQYLNLGFTPPSNYLKTEIKIYPTSTGDMRAGGIYDGSNRANVHYIGMQNKIRGGFGSNDYAYYNSYSANTLYEISMEANGGTYSINFNGTPYTGTYSGTVQVSTSRPYFLFANQENGSPGEYYTGRIYYFKATTSEGLIRDLVPCYRVVDGTIGMYDLVEGKFYGNSGTGTFFKGASVNVWQMPSGYTELQYIQSNGNQVIKTEVYLDKAGYRANLEYQSLTTSPSDQAMFGLYYEGTDYAYRCGYGTNNTNGFTLSLGGTSLDRQTAVGVKTTLVRETYQFYLFAKQRYDDGRYDCGITGRLYNCQIYDNDDNLVRDFVSCIRDSDGVLGLYDLVSKQFFANSGTGDFVAGPIVMRDGRKPGPNTLLYLPLNGDLLDKSGNNNNGTADGTITFPTIGNKQYALFGVNSAIELTSLPVSGNNPSAFTQSVRLKTNSNGVSYMHHFGRDTAQSRSNVIIFYSNNHRPINDTYVTDIYLGNAASSDMYEKWINVIYTYNNGTHKLMINGQLYGTGSGNLNIVSGYNKYIGRKDSNNGGYALSECIFESGERTENQGLDYFNETKKNYGYT